MDKSQVWASVGSIAVQTRHDWSELVQLLIRGYILLRSGEGLTL